MMYKNIQAEAEKILRSLKNDLDLVPSDIAKWWVDYLHAHRQRYLDTVSFLERDDSKTRILEIGSVPGQFTALLARLGYHVQGVDVDPGRVKGVFGKYGICVIKVDVEHESLPFPPNSFDIVLFAEILEHLRLNPLHTLREVHRVLRPTGRIILSTPNITPIQRLLFLFGDSYQGDPVESFKKLQWLGHMGHIRLYSLQEVKDFLDCSGFTTISYAYGGMNMRRVLPPKTRKPKLAKLFMLLMSMYPKKAHLRQTLYVIAEKSGRIQE